MPELGVVDFFTGPLGLSTCQFLGIRDLTNLCFVSKGARDVVATFLRVGSVGRLDRGGFDMTAMDIMSVWSESMTQKIGRLFGAVTTGMGTEGLRRVLGFLGIQKKKNTLLPNTLCCFSF